MSIYCTLSSNISDRKCKIYSRLYCILKKDTNFPLMVSISKCHQKVCIKSFQHDIFGSLCLKRYFYVTTFESESLPTIVANVHVLGPFRTQVKTSFINSKPFTTQTFFHKTCRNIFAAENELKIKYSDTLWLSNLLDFYLIYEQRLAFTCDTI